MSLALLFIITILLIISLFKKGNMKTKKIEFDYRIMAAYHEAGHAAVRLFYNHKIKSISIKRKTGKCIAIIQIRSDRFCYRDDNRPKISLYNLELIQISFAGWIAAKLKLINLPNEDGSKSDYLKYSNDIMAICLDRKKYGDEYAKLYDWLKLRTTETLKIIWPAVEAIAKELLEKKEMSGQRALELYRNAKVNKFKNRYPE